MVQRVKDCYSSIVLSLERESEERNDAKACGLFLYVTEYQFTCNMRLLCEVLSIVNRLSLMFQTESSDLSILPHTIESTVSNLQRIKNDVSTNDSAVEKIIKDVEGKGIEVKKNTVQQRAAVTNFQVQYLNRLIQNIQDRFDDASTGKPLEAFSIFDATKLPNPVSPEFKTYGISKLETLITQFGLSKQECIQECTEIKPFLSDHHRGKKLHELVKFLASDSTYKLLFPNICKLCQACQIIPIHTADCERDISKMRLINTVLCNRLTSDSLDCLIRIATNGPPVEEFPFHEALSHWRSQKTRGFSIKLQKPCTGTAAKN